MPNAGELVMALRSFRSRKQAMEQLVELGQEAVPALIEALDERNEGMRWATIRCLGEIGSDEAIVGLVARLDNPRDAETACWALGRVSGRDFGSDVEKWRAWAGQANESAKPAGEGDELDDSTLLREALRGLKATAKTHGRSCRVRLELDGGRNQTVGVTFGSKDFEGSQIVIVYSECAPADPKHYEYALRANLTLPYGALAIREVDGEKRLVMFNSLLRSGLTPLALRKSIVIIADKADKIEKRITGQDKR